MVRRSVPWAKIELLQTLGVPKSRYHAVAPSLGRSGCWVVHNNSLACCRRGLVERVFAVEGPNGLRRPPQARQGVFERYLDEFAAAVVRGCGWTSPMSEAEFANSYTGMRATRYRTAVESLGTRAFRKQDAYLSTFVKGEAVKLTAAKPDPAPRVIQPRSPRYNVLVGRYLRPLEHKVYDAIALAFHEAGISGGSPVVFKGINSEQAAQIMREKWDRFHRPRGMGSDATRFDQHVGPQALDWEHSVYVRCYRGSPELASLLKLQIDNLGFVRASDGALKYKVKGCRMSGDMNTSLGNCLIMCGLVYAFAREHGLKLELANNGDDCQIICEAKDIPTVAKFGPWALKFGFQMVMEPAVEEFEHLEFCQTKPVFMGGAWRMCRDPSKALSKDLIMKGVHKGCTAAEYRKWLACVGKCGLAATSGCPVFQSFYNSLIAASNGATSRLDRDHADSGFARMAAGLKAVSAPITPHARYSFWLAYGITPDEQVVLEHHFASNRVNLSRRTGRSQLHCANTVEHLT